MLSEYTADASFASSNHAGGSPYTYSSSWGTGASAKSYIKYARAYEWLDEGYPYSEGITVQPAGSIDGHAYRQTNDGGSIHDVSDVWSDAGDHIGGYAQDAEVTNFDSSSSWNSYYFATDGLFSAETYIWCNSVSYGDDAGGSATGTIG